MMQGQDPTVVRKDGVFHLVQSDGRNIRLRRSGTLGGLVPASNGIIFTPSYPEVWAPELHFITNRWYLYYTANTNADSNGRARRGFVAESTGTNPTGPYVSKGIIFHDFWNIDGNAFTWNDQWYYTFSGEPVQGAQCIYIARMSNPYTLATTPVQISAPTKSWETVGTPDVNEGSWGFSRGGQLFVVYSASGCWTDSYALGLLTLTGSDPLDASSWTKSGPVFTQKAGAYGPGHNSLVQDTSGQWWNVYHANVNPEELCRNLRRIRAQRLFWKDNGVPDFGSPVPNGSVITDSPDFLAAHFPLTETSGVTAADSVSGRAGALNGPATWANPGLVFNGTNTYLDCGGALGNDVQHQLTLCAWIRPDRFSDWAGIISKGTNTSPYALQLWSDGSLRFTANFNSPPGAVGSGSWNSTAKLTLGAWQHVAVTYDGTRVRFYINGVMDSNQPAVSLRCGVAEEPLVIGADFPGGDEFFQGVIRSARVYGRPLTAQELAAMDNRPPQLGAYTNAQVIAGSLYSVPAVASDPDVPPQQLTFRLVSGPFGAAVNSLTGTFSWRPAIAQAPSTNFVRIAVTDNGVPMLGATQDFTVRVRQPVPPVMSAPRLEDDGLYFDVAGDAGPAYWIYNSTNLVDWEWLFTTNPVSLPFTINVPATNVTGMFYRLENR